jgi:hypothetical protein
VYPSLDQIDALIKAEEEKTKILGLVKIVREVGTTLRG